MALCVVQFKAVNLDVMDLTVVEKLACEDKTDACLLFNIGTLPVSPAVLCQVMPPTRRGFGAATADMVVHGVWQHGKYR